MYAALFSLTEGIDTIAQGTIRLYHPDYAANRGAVLAVSYVRTLTLRFVRMIWSDAQGIIAISTAIACSSISRSPWLWRAVCASPTLL